MSYLEGTYQIKKILEEGQGLNELGTVVGWVKSHRLHGKNISFIWLNDGSTPENLQVIFKEPLEDIPVGSAIEVGGETVLSVGEGQTYEFKAVKINVLKKAENFPIQKKEHTFEWLRENAHIRHRTGVFTCVSIVKNKLYQLVNEFFNKEGFKWVQAPILTSNSCEGGAESFVIEGAEKFFKNNALMSVSGQFHAEALALGLQKVYTFGPTFRAEKSNTSNHLAEFWMIEPEISFCHLDGLMKVMEDFMKYVINGVLEQCKTELKYLSEKVPENSDLINKLKQVAKKKFTKLEYREAINLLVQNKVEATFGDDLSSEQEKLITKHFNNPVFVYNYPKKIKSFYMKEVDGVVVSSVDLLVPGVGELMGGSERENDKDLLIKKAEELGIPLDNLDWYVNLRDYGYYASSGFGCGFERLVLYATGIKNIKDAIHYPRAYGQLDY